LLSASLGICLLFGAQAGPGLNDSLLRAIDFGYRQEYDSARRLVAAVAQAYPQDPAGPYWQAALCQLLVYDAGDLALVDSFNRFSDSAILRARRRLAADQSDAAAQFYLGMAQLNRANLQNWQRQKVGAAMTAVRAAGSLRAAARLAPDSADYACGLGMLEYFQSYAGRLLPGGGGAAGRAMALVRRAADGGTLCRASAEYSLCWMLGDQGRHDSAVAGCYRLLERYPGNRSGMRLLRDNLIEAGRCREAIVVGADLERSIRAAFPRNRYGLAENWLKMAKAYERLGQKDSALSCAERIIGWQPYAAHVPWLANYVKEAGQLARRVGRK
jgi:tetratricopeptide (TPR) repeat protein